jgi:hypothetical protein
MKFHLGYHPEKSTFNIEHKNKVLLLGSCFAENIGGIMKELRFSVNVNPAGIMFNPLSIGMILNRWINREKINTDHFVERGDECFSYLHHSSLKASSVKELERKLNHINAHAAEEVKNTDFLIITFGSAYYYEHKQLGICVANCHKQPAQNFEKKLAGVDEITSSYEKALPKLLELNNKLKIIFTVSPVKYLKDGIVENNLSKSMLTVSVHQLTKKFPGNCSYFPAYELVNDDLRDYRFYKEDLAHPNEQAIKYIWEKFSETYFDQPTIKLNELINKLNLAEDHRTLHQNEEEEEKLESHVNGLKEQIRKLNPDLTTEIT